MIKDKMRPDGVTPYIMHLDITGQRFGRLIAIEPTGKNSYGQQLWACQCDCGQTVPATIYLLKHGQTRSCGCLKAERVSQANQKITKQQAREIKESDRTCRALAAEYGISYQAVSLIKRGETWADL